MMLKRCLRKMFSHFETSASARFLAMFMTLEVLMTHTGRSDAARGHVERLIQITKAADIPQDDKLSLLGAIAWLKNQSIAQTGRKMAEDLLGDARFQSLRAEEFFYKMYKTRNDLVHRGIVNPDALHTLVGDADQFVSEILQRRIIDHETVENPKANPTSPSFGSFQIGGIPNFLNSVKDSLTRYWRRLFD